MGLAYNAGHHRVRRCHLAPDTCGLFRRDVRQTPHDMAVWLDCLRVMFAGEYLGNRRSIHAELLGLEGVKLNNITRSATRGARCRGVSHVARVT